MFLSFIIQVILILCAGYGRKNVSPANTNPDLTSGGAQGGLRHGCVAYYLHNHKTGGSTMCHTAEKSGYYITTLQDNCNLPYEIVRNDRKNRNRGIAQHYVLNHHPKLTFVAQELPPFLPNVSNNKYIYLTTIRNPIDRVISHIHHGVCTVRTVENSQQFLHNGNCSIADIRVMTLSDLILDPCFEKELLWLSSNYYISMFTGCTVNRKKISGVGQENVCSRRHLLLAQSKLHYFSVIMMTDTSEEYDRCVLRVTNASLNHDEYYLVCCL